MVFVGDYEHTIDAKNRLAIPAELRAMAVSLNRAADRAAGNGEGEDGKKHAGEGPLVFYVTLSEDGRCLCLYTERTFFKRADDLDNSERDPEELLDYEEVFYGSSRRLETDTQGRIRLPDNLLERVGLGREVVLVGVKDHIRIRDREQWKQRLDQALADGARKMLNPRRMMK